ncbi:Protein-L-isoaspartate O-methyltransferase domain-containing protein 1 [Halocaridina rubra]|uniref:Protein-L-isoaspartate O-methyltransferase domain-containing protein 1 n=1 Tax=Halocaridina rubra TaxID=373956 RepID=A0AAN8WGI1_HALRR
MPLNDQLVKVTRTGPTSWEMTSLLPVSFSSLVMPDNFHPPANVPLPEVELLDLQDMCRQEIRSILRANIDTEHPDLATVADRPTPKPRSRCSRQQFPGVFVPYMPVPFYESDDEPGMISDDNVEDSEENLPLFDSHRHTNQLTTVIEFARSLAGQRLLERELQNMRRQVNEEELNVEDNEEAAAVSDIDSSDTEDKHDSEVGSEGKSEKLGESSTSSNGFSYFKKEKVSEEKEQKEKDDQSTNDEAASAATVLPQSDPIPMTSTPIMSVKCNKKREKFDSGVGDEIENGKGPSSEESDQGGEGDVDMEIDSTDSDFSDGSPSRPKLRSRSKTKVLRRHNSDDPDCPCGGNCSESWKEKKEEEAKQDGKNSSGNTSSTESYSTFMREKIEQLPLPQALKMYLNYYREL